MNQAEGAPEGELGEDKPREECGVFGVRMPGPADVARLCHLGIFALQHRGQEACGICVTGGGQVRLEKDMGLVAEGFTEERLARLRYEGASQGVAHTRYSVTGSSLRFNAQPLTVRCNMGHLALVHNGNFTNAREIRDSLLEWGAVFQTTNDSEVMLNLIARHSHLDLVDATAEAMRTLEGGFAVVLMDSRRVIGLRDGHGVRPLVIGRLDGGHVFASEPAALSLVGAEFVRDVKPGELVVADDDGLTSRQVLTAEPTPCAFEWIYFARGDSTLDGVDVHAARVRMGMELAREAPVEADLVVGVPESGLAAGIGYSRVSGVPYDLGLYKSPYAGRSFISPTQELRELKVKLKLQATGSVRGKRVVLVDDSIVRGTTSGRIVQLLREAGAKEVHFRVSSPPIKFPCHYGIDTAARKELAAATLSVEEIRQRIGADSLHFLTEAGLRRALTLNGVCLACFNGKYPAGEPSELAQREGLGPDVWGL
ncbi:MAG TPA: amidophosphoribosyltransferase [Trueperaceae bacterium]|nr:amidophosphoribosyltransferase [Trueperaceae bacterium]